MLLLLFAYKGRRKASEPPPRKARFCSPPSVGTELVTSLAKSDNTLVPRQAWREAVVFVRQ